MYTMYVGMSIINVISFLRLYAVNLHSYTHLNHSLSNNEQEKVFSFFFFLFFAKLSTIKLPTPQMYFVFTNFVSLRIYTFNCFIIMMIITMPSLLFFYTIRCVSEDVCVWI